ncbi:MAG: hypothetical protein JNL42_11785 [Anaerolineae bacterium]|nr:hypothetical protein [Anaerolineae bacterium]
MRKVMFLLVVVLAALPFAAVGAQDVTPSVTVSDQVVFGDTVTIAEVVSAGNGFLVIHIDNGGSPGPVAGFAPVYMGVNKDVKVAINTAMATPMMFAMLHVDTGIVGEYEFGRVEGVDGPVVVDGAVVTPPFNAAIIDGHDQFLDGDSVTIDSVTIAQDGFLVIHAGDASSFGAVLGVTPVSAGTTADVTVEVAADGRTSVLWPMLHVDTGAVGTYEFGTVEGADGPVIVNGRVATAPIWTVPHIRASSQAVLHGDNVPAEDAMSMADSMMAPTVHIHSVLAEVDGFVVIHTDNGGAPGPVAGLTWAAAGYSEHLEAPLDFEGVTITPVLWPMLHVDTGTVGTYEFGTVEGADGPVTADGSVVTFPINAAPALMVNDQALGEGGTLTIAEAVIDMPGWLVIHMDNAGAPGPVIGKVWLAQGRSANVVVTLDDASAAGAQVFPMLHYDTGEYGVYEFGTVEGADAPVFVGGNVIFVPLAITG